MKNTFELLIKTVLVISLLFLSACAIGPLVANESARTVGDGNSEWLAGFGQASSSFKYSFGINEDLDFGIQAESLSSGLRLKKAFVNASEGWAFAGALGLGLSVSGSYYSGDLVASYGAGAWEPYGLIRIVHVDQDSTDVLNSDGSTFFITSSYSWNYGQVFLGTRYWLGTNWMLLVEASTLFTVDSTTTIANSGMVGAAIGYRY
jgi:hypothetical protein